MSTTTVPKRRILVLHGPNLNLTGRREPDVYGTATLAEIDTSLLATGAASGDELTIVQSNHEGALIDAIHAAMDDGADAVAVISDITKARDVDGRVREWLALLRTAAIG